jgi:APA family basic amino acid/polyamine antiporter
MGADGLISPAVGFVDRRGTPGVALLVSTAAALALLMTGTFESIATVFAFFAVTSYAGAFVSLLVLRRREPDLRRPFRSWGYPWTTLLVLAGALALLVGTVAGAPRQSAIAMLALAASYPVFRLTRRRAD